MGILDTNIGKGLSDDLSYITNDVLGIKSAKNNKVTQGVLPWFQGGSHGQGPTVAGLTPSTSKFMPPISIDPDRWDQLFPYRLIVIDTQAGNSIVGGDQNQVSSQIQKGTGDDYIINFTPINSQWLITLPITPEQLSISDQFAINTTATLRGVAEEHNGVKFKMINASGTFGSWPYRESVAKSPTTPGLIRSLFGSTLDALSNVISSVGNVISDITGSKSSKYAATHPKDSTAGVQSTGYYFALATQQFIEQYAEAKKKPENAGWRLVFDIPKQNTSYIVSPMIFNWSQNATKAAWINYNVQFKAWRRIDLKNKATAVPLNINKVSPGLLQQILNTVTDARTVMAQSLDLISAVRSDADRPLQILSQVSLLLKDGAGVGAAAADLPNQIANDYSSSITSYIYNNKTAIMQANTDPDVRSTVKAIVADKIASEGLTNAAVANGQIGNSAVGYQNASPTNQLFQQPAKNFALLNSVPTSSLVLTTAQQNELNDLLEQIRELTVDDLKQFKDTLDELAYQISNYYGASTAYYNNLYGKGNANTRTQPLSLDEYDVLNALYGVTQGLEILTATTYFDDIQKQTNMEYVAGLASDSNIPFDLPNSKIYVPVPYNLTIEGIAARYLNDADRWLEIATLNNLREPYIDETGFQKPLLSNGIDRQITVADSDNLYIGQRVTLKSTTAVPNTRRILGIDVLSDSSVLLTLDGDSTLGNYTTDALAYLQAYLPGTTNSQQKIFIPSDLQAQLPDGIVTPSAVAGDPLVGLSQVDFLMTDDGDLATNNYGDFRLAAGMTNLIQALKIKISTIKGTMILHPDFGLGIRAGMSTADISPKVIYDTISKLVKDDPRFGGIEKLQIQIKPAALVINLTVFLANGNGVLPLTFDIKI